MRSITALLVIAIVLGCNQESSQEPPPRPILVTKTLFEPDVPKQCPDDMVEIEGEFCPNVQEICIKWVDIKGQAIPEAIPDDGESGRCGEFKYPTVCRSTKRVHLKFCIDRFEFPNIEGEVPCSWMSWYDARDACEARGKRLCQQHEWSFACEGPEMHPLPYGDGYHRDRVPCNLDNSVKGIDVFKAREPGDETAQILQSLLVPAGSLPACVSPFGVHEMVANIDEWVVNESGGRWPSGLMSGHVFGVRNRCRAITTGHNPPFKWYETGARCCK